MTKVTDDQVLQALKKANGVKTVAAELLGINESSVRRRVQRMAIAMGGKNNDKAALRDPGMGRQITRVTNVLGANGELKGQFVREGMVGDEDSFDEPEGRVVKTTAQIGPSGIERVWERRVPDGAAALADRLEEVIAKLPPFQRGLLAIEPGVITDNLHMLYPFADAHIGALCWAPETGGDWDCKIAADTLKQSIDQMVIQCPATRSATVVFLGDWLHYDSLEAVTPTSRHLLDADGRYSKLVDIAIDVALHIVRRVLEYHQQVEVLVAEGNHDLIGTVWLRKLIAHLFKDDDRVKVIDSPMPYYVTTFGSCFLGFHHGHLKNVKSASDLIAYFAQEFRQDWGQSSSHFIHTGHKHFLSVDSSKGAQIRQHPTIAARDAFSARHGYQSYRAIQAIAYHRDHGERMTLTFTPEMLSGE